MIIRWPEFKKKFIKGEKMLFSNKKPKETMHIYASGKGEEAQLIIKQCEPYSKIESIYIDLKDVDVFLEMVKEAVEKVKANSLEKYENED